MDLSQQLSNEMAMENVQRIEKSSSSVSNNFQPHPTFNPPNIFSYLASEDDDLRLRASKEHAKVLQSSKEVKKLIKQRNKELQSILNQIESDKIKEANHQKQLYSSASYESKLKGLGSTIKQNAKKRIHHLLAHPYLNINRISSELKTSSLHPPKESSNFSELGSSRSQFNQVKETPIIYYPSINQKIHQWQTNLIKTNLNPNIPSPGREIKHKEYSVWH